MAAFQVMVLILPMVFGCNTVGNGVSVFPKVTAAQVVQDIEVRLINALLGAQDQRVVVKALVNSHQDEIKLALASESVIDGEIGPCQKAMLAFIKDPLVWDFTKKRLQEYQPYYGFTEREMEQIRVAVDEFYTNKLSGGEGEEYAMKRIKLIALFAGIT
ncbi:MAG: hypothetical protein CMI53_03015 [Parcubacteria group bacterium]|nr:hypothetical protein [Parcubacteria group bacterium]